MNGGNQPFGYTIIEVLIVLAASGMMFVAAASFISGKQARTSFTAGVNEMASRMQDVIQQVNDGRYSDVRFNCSLVGGKPFITTGTRPGPYYTGKNPECIFLGKFMYFNSDNTNTYKLISLAGARLKSDNKTPITDLSEAQPTEISDLTDNLITPQSLDVRNVKITNAGSTKDGYGFGIVQGLGSTDGTGGSNGSAQLVYDQIGLTNISSTVDDLTTIQSVAVCLTDGQRFATLSIDNKLSSLSVDTVFGATGSCS